MNATEATRIEIDDRIRERPDLLRAITETTHYLTEQAVEAVPPPATIGWRYADTDGKLLQLTLQDFGDNPQHTVQRNLWTRWILDPVNQKLGVLSVWGEFLDKRSDTRLARITHLNAKLKEELGNGEDTD